MIKSFASISAIVFILMVLVSIIYKPENNVYMPIQYTTDPYLKLWEKVDSLESEGLVKSARELVQEIYKKARLENNPAQLVKSQIYTIKYFTQVDEESQVKIISALKEEIELSEHPVKPVLQSMLAEMYWLYYTQNRWQFSNRSETVNFDNDDIQTWDLTKLSKEVAALYLASIEHGTLSKRISIQVFDAILKKGNADRLRPTLYDFLAHRALDYFMNDEAYLTQPAYKFNLTGDAIFGKAKDFAKLKIQSKDTVSLKYNATLILQDLLVFHLKDKNPDALIDVDLKRLKFMRSNAINDLKDSLYLSSLQHLQTAYIKNKVSTIIGYEIAGYYYQKGSTYNALKSENHKWDKKEAIKICKESMARFPESVGAEQCKQLINIIQSKEILFNIEEVNIPNQPFRAFLKFKNIFKLYGRAIKLDDKINSDFMRKKIAIYNNGILDEILKYPTVTEWEIELPSDGDYQEHSTELKIPALENGYYAILIGSNKNMSYENNIVAYNYTHVSNISVINQTENNQSNSFYVLNRENGSPLKNVTAQLYSGVYNNITRKNVFVKKEKYVTDAEGHFNVRIPKSYRDYQIQFQYGNDRLTLNNSYYSQPYYDYKENGTVRTFFFTDRAIYRPGQTIYFKGIIIQQNAEGNNKILTNYHQTVTLYDVNQQAVSKLNLTTNEFGTFSGSFTAPSGSLNGQMYIMGGNNSVHFSVEEYKRPKFEVGFKPFEGSYKLGDEINITGFAKAYAGSNIDGAKVSYRVVREASFPYWWGYGGFGYSHQKSMEIEHGIAKTNEKGEFEIQFKALPDASISPRQKPQFNYTVYADVTDINGETHGSTTYIRLGYIALSVSVHMPQSFNLNEKQEISIGTTNLSGVFEAAKGNISIHKLKSPSKVYRNRYWTRPDKFVMSKEEYYALFPYDLYDNEDDYTQWKLEKEVLNKDFDTGKNKILSLNSISGWVQGKYLLTLQTQDKYGESITVKKYFDTVSPGSEELPTPQLSWYRPVHTTTQPGDTALIQWGSSAKNVTALVEIEHKQKIIEKKWVKLSGNKNLIELPVKEMYRGGVQIHITYITHGRAFNYTQSIQVPWSNKHLNISFETFRSKLYPGQEEEWKLKIAGPDGEKIAAEMVATMYDASLDTFKPNYWGFNIYPYNYSYKRWNTSIGFKQEQSRLQAGYWNNYYGIEPTHYDALNWFGFSYYWSSYNYYGRGQNKLSPSKAKMAEESVVGRLEKNPEVYDDTQTEEELDLDMVETKGVAPEKPSDSPVQIRKNLNETAFFYPHLQTNEQGEVIISFTIPEALTKWKFMAFAHTKDLKYGFADSTTVTQKELMVMPNPPRFLREGDTMEFTAKVSNLTDENLTGIAELKLFDALTMKPVDAEMENTSTGTNFTVKKGQSTGLSWKIKIPEGLQAVTYRVVAKTDKHSDGEEAILPVLTNRMLVTESLPLPIRGNQTKTFTLKKLIDSNKSKSLTHNKLTLEFTSNPAWYAVQALPYLMEYPYECSEQVFSRFYANSMASHIANSNPGIKNIFNQWKNTDALVSNLAKNEELKSLVLQETPWVLDAISETERKKRIGLLFDLNRMSNEMNSALTKLKQNQTNSGGWAWFKGMKENRYITQHIITGFGRLNHLGITQTGAINKMAEKGVYYLDEYMQRDYEWIVKHGELDSNNLNYLQIQYLYARSYFQHIPMPDKFKKAFEYYKSQAKEYWLKNNRYAQGMIALALHRYGDDDKANHILKSLKEHALYSEEMGMYWKANTLGFYWYESPIETQSLLIEAFGEIGNDQKSVEELKLWLLKQKQTQDWGTTKATADACYALLLRGANWLTNDELVEVTVGKIKIDLTDTDRVSVEAGTGYFKTHWSGKEIKPSMGTITVVKKDDGPAWGALYWQYFEDLDKITPHETPLKLKKQLFLQKNTATGPVIEPISNRTQIKPGDLIKVRIELRVDRDMEFIHMKDMRASALEPLNVLSGYRYQDGLGYYQSTKDASTNFFFDWLTKGTYVFEYSLRVTHKGNFSNGITTIQSMYAPEFTSHSEGVRIEVK